MKEYLKHYRATLTVLGPLHISSGQTVGKKEYIFDSERHTVFIPQLPLMYQWILRNGKQESFEDFMLRDKVDFAAWLQRERIPRKVWEEWTDYKLDSTDAVSDTRSKVEIQTYIKDPYGMVYIPGSSLKGAIRTTLLGAAIYRNRDRLERERTGIRAAEFKGRKGYLAKEYARLEERVFHTAGRSEKTQDKVNDCMAGLRISDSKPISADCLILCRKQDEMPNGTVKELNILRECIRPGTKLEFHITIDSTLYKGKRENILRAVRQFGECYMECFSKKFSSGDSMKGAMLYLGGGSGYVSKTVTYPLFGEKGVEIISKILNNTLPSKLRTQHRHGVCVW